MGPLFHARHPAQFRSTVPFWGHYPVFELEIFPTLKIFFFEFISRAHLMEVECIFCVFRMLQFMVELNAIFILTFNVLGT
jgi:hypothetical protein